MSQRSAQLLSLPLLKYSRAADVTREVEHFAWSHIQQGLLLVFEVIRGTDDAFSSPPQMLKILQGSQVLEAIPIQEMIAQSDEVIRTMLQLRVQVKNEQLPISALTKRPLLALRYNLPGDKIRRIQVKFTSGEDFDACYNHLASIGLRMSTSGERPQTANASSTVNNAGNGGPSCPPARLAEINNRPNTASAFPSTYVSPTVPKISSPLARHSAVATPTTQRKALLPRPTSASTPVPRESHSAHVAPLFPNSNPLEPPEYFQRPDSASSAMGRPSSSASRERDHVSLLPTIEEGSSFPTVPSSSAMLSTHRQSSDAVLPPRRELPFTRPTPPKSSGSDSIRPLSRASSGSMPPPPLPSPSQSAKPTSSFGRNSSMELARPSSAQTTSLEDCRERRHNRPNSSPGHPSSFTSDLPPLPQPTIIENTQSIARMHSSPASYNISTTRAQQSAQPLRNLTQTVQNVLSSSPLPPFRTPARPESSYQDRVISEIESAGPNSYNDLASYSAQSEDDRMTMLNDFMMQHIDDENFINLVEDVSVCWARIGLGLG